MTDFDLDYAQWREGERRLREADPSDQYVLERVVGRIAAGRLWLDCRCLEPSEEAAFVAQLGGAADTG